MNISRFLPNYQIQNLFPKNRSFMSKNKKQSKQAEIPQNVAKEIDTEKPVFINKSGETCLNIFAKPGAKDTSIVEIQDDAVNVRIAAPPVDGEANKELIKYISKLFNLRSSDVSLDKGSKNRNKVLILSNCKLGVEEILSKLKTESES